MKNHFCTASFAFSLFIREAIHRIHLIKVSEMFLASRSEGWQSMYRRLISVSSFGFCKLFTHQNPLSIHLCQVRHIPALPDPVRSQSCRFIPCRLEIVIYGPFGLHLGMSLLPEKIGRMKCGHHRNAMPGYPVSPVSDNSGFPAKEEPECRFAKCDDDFRFHQTDFPY